MDKFLEGIRAQREELEEAIMECEEKQQQMESVEEEILKRATEISEQINEFKSFLIKNTANALAFASCIVFDTEKIKDILNVEKEALNKDLEKSKKSQMKLKESFNAFLIEQ